MALVRSSALIDRVVDGRYRVVRHLAHGGMGSVYLAIDQRLDREVALKVMRPELAQDPGFVARFRKEARAAARLSHPNVVAVHDQGEDDGTVFLAMELLDGGTLRSWLDQVGALTPHEALGTLLDVLNALAAAHRAGIVHRDVKPENVLLSSEGTVKVGDFGLARAVSGSAASALSGTVLGTVAYLAPEQVERGVADPRSDVYAAGLMLHEMLTGRPALDGDSPFHVAFQHVHGTLPRPSDHAPGLPAALDELVAQATRRDPDERPADAGAWIADVERCRRTLTPAQQHTRPDRPRLDTADRLGNAADDSSIVSAVPVLGRPGVAAASGRDTGILSRATRVLTFPEPISPPDEPQVEPTGPRVEPAEPTVALAASAAEPTAAIAGLATRPGELPATSALAVDERTITLPATSSPAPLAPTTSPAPRAAAGRDAPGGTGPVGVPAAPAVPGSPGSPGQPDDPDPSRGAGKRRAGWVLLALGLVAALAVGWYVGIGPGSARPVPAVVGVEQARAVGELESVSLRAGLVQEYSETVPAGHIIAAEPSVGSPATRWSEVTLTVSRGPERYPVPNLSGATEAQLSGLLEEQHLKLGSLRRAYDQTVPVGVVVSSRPKAGTPMRPGAVVDVTVSRGVEPIRLADWTGKLAKTAATTLRSKGLKVQITGEEFDSRVRAGAILRQRPAPGIVHRGDTVSFVVSKGPVLVVVPDVRGENEAEARGHLESAGFTVEIERIAGGLFGTAHSTTPQAGAKAPRGSTIVLRIV